LVRRCFYYRPRALQSYSANHPRLRGLFSRQRLAALPYLERLRHLYWFQILGHLGRRLYSFQLCSLSSPDKPTHMERPYIVGNGCRADALQAFTQDKQNDAKFNSKPF
jgi:hypothetical protein